ncbi:MAG: hypothetical protein KAW02_00925 [candidate division Zixibacteria bacterium]|nr:hypothetical protein [candidate division Zixibacteria bacterium]
MKSILLCVATIILFSINIAQAGLMETIPVGEEVYRWVYEYLDELYARGLITELHLGTKPYFRGKVAEELLSLREKRLKGELSLGWPEDYLLGELENEFLSEINELELKASSPNDRKVLKKFSWGLDFQEGSNFRPRTKAVFRETFLPYAKAQIGSNFFACTRYMIDENLAKDPHYEGKVWRGFAGDAAQAYLAFNLPYFKVLLGRERIAWGQKSTQELILSERASPLDMVKIQGGWGIFQGTAFFAFLSPLTTQDFSGDVSHINRYLSGHRISLNLFSKAQLGFSETIVYGGRNRQVEAYYLNPLLWYHGAQLNEKRDDNTFFAFDFNLRPKRGLLFYGEFLIDDFQIEKKNQGDKEPNELGYSGGFCILDIFGFKGTELSLEYIRINNWTYNQKEERNRYLNRKKLLGNPMGPDTDNFSASLSAWLRRGLKSKITYQKRRCGEGGVDSPWSEPWMLAEGEYKEKFPSGVVEKMNNLGIALQYNYTNLFRCELSWNYFDFVNYKNIQDHKEDFSQVSLNLSYHFLKM